MAYGHTLRPEPTGLFCTDLPLCDTDTEAWYEGMSAKNRRCKNKTVQQTN